MPLAASSAQHHRGPSQPRRGATLKKKVVGSKFPTFDAGIPSPSSLFVGRPSAPTGYYVPAGAASRPFLPAASPSSSGAFAIAAAVLSFFRGMCLSFVSTDAW